MAAQPATLSTTRVIATRSMQDLRDGPIVSAAIVLPSITAALEFFMGVPATVLTDNMKTVVLDRVDGQPFFHPKMLDFASYYGFVPRVCRPYRPETKGKIESTIFKLFLEQWAFVLRSTSLILFCDHRLQIASPQERYNRRQYWHMVLQTLSREDAYHRTAGAHRLY